MKRTLILLALCLVCLTSAAFAETADYVYYNHDGGEYYHARPDCERIGQGYWNAMTKIAAEELPDETFAGLKRCAWCFGEIQQPDVPAGKMVWHYESPYDTGSDVEIAQAGKYVAGVDLNPGLYTVTGGVDLEGSVTVTDKDGVATGWFMLGPGASYSFYLAESASVELPEGCILRKLQYGPEFQTMDKVEVVARKYSVMYECPGRIYCVTAANEAYGGSARVTMLDPKTGREKIVEEAEIAPGQTITIDLQQGYDHFLEIKNCIIWPAEEGEG